MSEAINSEGTLRFMPTAVSTSSSGPPARDTENPPPWPQAKRIEPAVTGVASGGRSGTRLGGRGNCLRSSQPTAISRTIRSTRSPTLVAFRRLRMERLFPSTPRATSDTSSAKLAPSPSVDMRSPPSTSGANIVASNVPLKTGYDEPGWPTVNSKEGSRPMSRSSPLAR